MNLSKNIDKRWIAWRIKEMIESFPKKYLNFLGK